MFKGESTRFKIKGGAIRPSDMARRDNPVYCLKRKFEGERWYKWYRKIDFGIQLDSHTYAEKPVFRIVALTKNAKDKVTGATPLSNFVLVPERKWYAPFSTQLRRIVRRGIKSDSNNGNPVLFQPREPLGLVRVTLPKPDTRTFRR